jgi:hypothetical protein
MLRPGHRKHGHPFIGLLAGLAVSILAGSASSVAAAAESDKAVARAHYETATRLYDLREYAKALDEYKAAYLAKPDPAFLFNIGQCFRKLGNTASAVDFYQQYLKKTPPDDPNRAQAEARIRDIEVGRDSEEDPFAKDEERTKPRPDVRADPPRTPDPVPPSVPAVPEGRRGAGGSVTNPSPIGPPQSQVSIPTPTTLESGRTDLVAPPPVEQHPSSRIYGQWWFWAGVGVAVLAGAVTAIALSRGGESNSVKTTLGTQEAFQ